MKLPESQIAHDKAMDLSEKGIAELKQARRHFQDALELEQKAVTLAVEENPKDPWNRVLEESAAELAITVAQMEVFRRK